MKKGGKEDLLTLRFDLGNDSGCSPVVRAQGDEGVEKGPSGGREEPHREAAPPFLCVQRAKQVRSASL